MINYNFIVNGLWLIAKGRVCSIIKSLVGFLKDVKLKQEDLTTVYFKRMTLSSFS